jgi:ssDNA-binding replication factor A large subunit
MTLIPEIQPRQGNIEISEAEIVSKDEPREFEKFGNKGKVCNCKIKDSSGEEIILTLWNDDCENYKVGDKVKLTNGYCGEFQGEKQLTAGKFGKLEKVEAEA